MIFEIISAIIIVILLAFWFSNRGRIAKQEIEKWALKNNYILKEINLLFFKSVSGIIRSHLYYSVRVFDEKNNINYLFTLNMGELWFEKISFNNIRSEEKINLDQLNNC